MFPSRPTQRFPSIRIPINLGVVVKNFLCVGDAMEILKIQIGPETSVSRVCTVSLKAGSNAPVEPLEVSKHMYGKSFGLSLSVLSV